MNRFRFKAVLPNPKHLLLACVSGGCAAIAYSLDQVLWAYFFAFTALLLLQYAGNFPTKQRHRQWPILFAGLIYSLVSLALMRWVQTKTQAFLQDWDPLLSWLGNVLNISQPTDLVTALAWLNALLLLGWGGLKLTLAVGIRILPAPASQGPSTNKSFESKGAYFHKKQKGWSLKPQFLFLWELSRALTVLSTLWLLGVLLSYHGEFPATWLPIAPICLVIIFSEIAAYLGGGETAAESMDVLGDDATLQTWANYEPVWRGYRRVWKDQWLGTGKGAPWRSER